MDIYDRHWILSNRRALAWLGRALFVVVAVVVGACSHMASKATGIEQALAVVLMVFAVATLVATYLTLSSLEAVITDALAQLGRRAS